MALHIKVASKRPRLGRRLGHQRSFLVDEVIIEEGQVAAQHRLNVTAHLNSGRRNDTKSLPVAVAESKGHGRRPGPQEGLGSAVRRAPDLEACEVRSILPVQDQEGAQRPLCGPAAQEPLVAPFGKPESGRTETLIRGQPPVIGGHVG